MGQVDLSNYRSLYIQTAKENIDSLSAGCTELANNAQDLEAVTSLHINSHSLKSKSQVMGFINMANLCAIIEKISNDILNGVKKIDDKFITFLRKSVDELNLRLAQIEKGDAE